MLRSDTSHLSFSRLPVRTCLFLTRRGGESTAKKHPEQVILTITNTPMLLFFGYHFQRGLSM